MFVAREDAVGDGRAKSKDDGVNGGVFGDRSGQDGVEGGKANGWIGRFVVKGVFLTEKKTIVSRDGDATEGMLWKVKG